MPVTPIDGTSSSAAAIQAALERQRRLEEQQRQRRLEQQREAREAREARQGERVESRTPKALKTGFDKKITPQANRALQTMQRLARTAKEMYGDQVPGGMCAQAVRTILDAGNFPGAEAGRNRGALGLLGAKDYAEYWNTGNNAKKQGLERLDITNPYDAPPGSIIVIAPGHNANATWGDINIAVGNGQFINDGNMNLASRESWGPGDLLGVYAPIGASKIPGLEKLAGTTVPSGPTASYTPSTVGDSTSYTGPSTSAPAPSSPDYWNFFPTPSESKDPFDFTYFMLLLQDVMDWKTTAAFKQWKKENPHGTVNQFLKSQLGQIQQNSQGYFDLSAMGQALKNDAPGSQKQLNQLTHALVTGTTSVRALKAEFKG